MAKKSKNKNAGGGFNFKEFLLYHVEKIIFAFIALLSLALVYLGVTGQKFSANQNPADLKTKAEKAASEVVSQDRWEAILEGEPERTVTVSYSKIASETRGEVDANMYASNIWEQKSVEASKRGDPMLRNPIKLQGYYFSGPIATFGSRDIIEDFEDAKKPEEKAPPRRNRRQQAMNNMMMGSSAESMSSEYGMPGSEAMSSGSGLLGSGMPGAPGSGPGGLNAPRRLQPAYDLGFQLGQRTFGGMGGGMGGSGYSSDMGLSGGGYGSSAGYGSGAGYGSSPSGGYGAPSLDPSGPGGAGRSPRRPMTATVFNTVVVTALIEHRELETAYDAEFMNMAGYMPGRDNPNYQGFEVQRVVVNANTKAIAEGDWQTIKEASSEGWKEFAKKTFQIGTAAEVSSPAWTSENLSMEIPPFLIVDYAAFCGHSDVPKARMDPITDAFFFAPQGNTSPYGAGGGYGSSTDYGMGGSSSYGAGGYGAGGYGAGGYGAGGYGDSSYGSGGYGSSMDSLSSGSGYDSGGYGSSMSMDSAGYGSAGGYGAGGGYGTGVSASPPRRLPSTKYKLVRFFDPTVQPGVSYRYRVRLKMYDPNFPEFEGFAPKSSDLKPDVLTRVQDLRAKELPDKVTQKRVSERLTDWSAASDVIVASAPTPVYAGELDGKSGQYQRLASTGQAFTVKPPKSEVSISNQLQFLSFPLKEKSAVSKGHIIAGDDRPNKEGIEFVNPVSKLIKVPKKKREDGKPFNVNFPTVVVNIVDIGGGVPLSAWTSKDDMRTGGEIVAFDSLSGQIVVSREFEDYTDFNRNIKPDAIPVGPLGGPMGGASMTSGMGGSSEMYGSGGYGPN